MSAGLFRQIKRNSPFPPDFSHLPELPSRSSSHLVSARGPRHPVLGRLVWHPCDKQQHHHWAPDIIMKHNARVCFYLRTVTKWLQVHYLPVLSGCVLAFSCSSCSQQNFFRPSPLEGLLSSSSILFYHECYSNYWCPSREKLGQLNLRSMFSS